MPNALQWKGVAELIARGLSSLPPSAIVSVIVAAAFAPFIEIMTIVRKKPFPLSSVSIGLGVIPPPDACFAMWIGAMIFSGKEDGMQNPARTVIVSGSEAPNQFARV
jgi:hypothetical protein